MTAGGRGGQRLREAGNERKWKELRWWVKELTWGGCRGEGRVLI